MCVCCTSWPTAMRRSQRTGARTGPGRRLPGASCAALKVPDGSAAAPASAMRARACSPSPRRTRCVRAAAAALARRSRRPARPPAPCAAPRSGRCHAAHRGPARAANAPALPPKMALLRDPAPATSAGWCSNTARSTGANMAGTAASKRWWRTLPPICAQVSTRVGALLDRRTGG